MKCPNCYNENEAGRDVCKYCGTVLPEEPIPVNKENIEDNSKIQEDVKTNEQEQLNEQIERVNEPLDIQTTEEVNEETQTSEKKQLKEQVQEAIEKFEVQSTEEAQEENQTREQEVTVEPKKVKIKSERKKINFRKVKKVLIMCFVWLIVIGIIVSGIYVFLAITSTPKIYQKAIQILLNNTISNSNIDAKSFEYSTKMSLVSPESSSLAILNGFNIDASLGADFNEESSILKVKVDKDTTKFIDATVLADFEHRLVYLGEPDAYDQYIRLDIPEEYIDQINSIVDFNYLAQRDTRDTRNKIRTIIETELKKTIAQGTFSRTQASITYNGENKNVRDDIFTITEGQYKNLINNIGTKLLNDDELLNSFGSDRLFVEKYIQEILDKIIYYKEDDEVEVPNYVRLHIYTSQLKFEFMGIRIEYNSDFNEQKANILLYKNSDNTYVFNLDILANKKERILTANISRYVAEDGTSKLGFEVIYNQQLYRADIEYNYSINQGIESLDMSRVTKYDDLEEEDYDKISSNFKDLPMYKYLESAIAFIQENEYINELLSAKIQTELPNNITLEDNQSYLITYNNKVVVFEVPVAFENSYSGNMYKSYRKNNRIGNRADIYLNLISEDVEDLLKSYIKSYDYLTAKEYKTEVDRRGNEYQVEIPSKYKDVSISDISTENINDIEYSKVVVKYTTDEKGEQNITYYATKFNDDYTYVVRLEDASEIVLDTEMEKILTITKYID